MRHQIELLAPAGSFESLRAAVNAGADAVYIGGSRFGARAYADNPDEEGLCQAIRFAHLHGCDLYLTVNTLLKDEELENLGVTPIDAVGQEFDPELHNAVMQVENDELESGTVAQELQKGYKYRDSVVRHSMVAVVQ